ncbi:MAG: hypothetical protein ABIH26_08625 [Candidatus Eisenbacteria bacterium]
MNHPISASSSPGVSQTRRLVSSFESPRYFFQLLGDGDEVLQGGEAQHLYLLLGKEWLYTPRQEAWKLFQKLLPER